MRSILMPVRRRTGELLRVWKFFQDRIVPRRLEVFQRNPKDWIQKRARMQDVKIERRQLVTEMQLRIVIERAAHIVAYLLVDRPTNHVALCVEIKMKVEHDVV